MASSAVTSYGLDWKVDRILDGDSHPSPDKIAVGTGTKEATESDTSLESQSYEAAFSDIEADIYSVEAGSADGIYRANITVSGDVEVPGGTDITEIGLFDANGNLYYREVRAVTTVGSGERISFEVEVDLINS